MNEETEEKTGSMIISACNLFKNRPSPLESDSEEDSLASSSEELSESSDSPRYVHDVGCREQASTHNNTGEQKEGISDRIVVLYDRTWTCDFSHKTEKETAPEPELGNILSSAESVSTSTSSLSRYSKGYDRSSEVIIKDGFRVCLNWKVRGANVIQVEGQPLNADVGVIDQFVESCGKVLDREVKWAIDQKFIRYKLATTKACVMAVACLHEVDGLFQDLNKPAEIVCYMP